MAYSASSSRKYFVLRGFEKLMHNYCCGISGKILLEIDEFPRRRNMLFVMSCPTFKSVLREGFIKIDKGFKITDIIRILNCIPL